MQRSVFLMHNVAHPLMRVEQVHGLDIAPCQAHVANFHQARNLHLHVPCDYEGEWPAQLQQGTCDLVHMQRLGGSVHNWFALYRKAFKYATRLSYFRTNHS